MKIFNNTYKLLIISIICATILASCNKDDALDVEQVSVDVGDGLKIVNYKRSNSNIVNSRSSSFSGTAIAVFNNKETYESYIEQLEEQVENWDDAFVAQWGHLSDEDLNAKEEELNFDSEKPLTDFENQTGLQSLRQKYLQKEDQWLNDAVMNISTHPDNNSIFDFDESEMTLLNNLSEVQIGTTIIKKLSDEEVDLLNNEIGSRNSIFGVGRTQPILKGASLMIAEEDYDSLIDFNNGDSSVIDNDNVTVNNSNTTVSCGYAKDESEDFSISSNKFIMTKIKVPRPSLGWNGKVKAKIKSYKDGLFGWRKWRTRIAAGAKGNVYNESCSNTPVYINNWTSTKKRKKRVYKWRNRSFGSHKVENGGMTGMFRHNNIVKELTLTW